VNFHRYYDRKAKGKNHWFLRIRFIDAEEKKIGMGFFLAPVSRGKKPVRMQACFTSSL
jgi:hypothetical protein